MAADDVTEIAITDGSAPASYELSSGQRLVPFTIEGFFDGSGAGSEFLACATLRSPSGRVLSRTFPTDHVAAGASAGVTFSPFA